MGCGASKDTGAKDEQGTKDSKGKSASKSTEELLAKIPEEPGSVPSEAIIIFVLGGPGSGKGTQCDLIVKKYNFKHLSAGDLLRDEVKSGSQVGKACEDIMKEGQLVPTEVTVALVKNAMIRSKATKFLIDGFPRAMDQAKTFEESILPCKRVLFFDCPEATMEERLLKRGQTSGRSDDNAETIKKRFHTFLKQSLPVVDHYREQGKLSEISAVPAPEEVFSHVEKAIDQVLAQADNATSEHQRDFQRGDLSSQVANADEQQDAEPALAAA